MQQAQKMQDNFKKAQEELKSIEVQGESGGGLVTIIMTGKREARKGQHRSITDRRRQRHAGRPGGCRDQRRGTQSRQNEKGKNGRCNRRNPNSSRLPNAFLNMQNQGLLKELIQSLCCLPGVGPKSAQRMAFHLFATQSRRRCQLSQTLAQAMAEIGHCRECQDLDRNGSLRSMQQYLARRGIVMRRGKPRRCLGLIDQATTFKGKYFVLHGRLSPLDGIGPDQLGFDLLEQRMASREDQGSYPGNQFNRGRTGNRSLHWRS